MLDEIHSGLKSKPESIWENVLAGHREIIVDCSVYEEIHAFMAKNYTLNIDDDDVMLLIITWQGE